jgi:hypothetical protein
MPVACHTTLSVAPPTEHGECPDKGLGPDGPLDTTLISDPLRREAERGWAESERGAAKAKRQRQVKARARTKRRETARRQKDEIAHLKGKL